MRVSDEMELFGKGHNSACSYVWTMVICRTGLFGTGQKIDLVKLTTFAQNDLNWFSNRKKLTLYRNVLYY